VDLAESIVAEDIAFGWSKWFHYMPLLIARAAHCYLDTDTVSRRRKSGGVDEVVMTLTGQKKCSQLYCDIPAGYTFPVMSYM
jgi:hypothetical protein